MRRSSSTRLLVCCLPSQCRCRCSKCSTPHSSSACCTARCSTVPTPPSSLRRESRTDMLHALFDKQAYCNYSALFQLQSGKLRQVVRLRHDSLGSVQSPPTSSVPHSRKLLRRRPLRSELLIKSMFLHVFLNIAVQLLLYFQFNVMIMVMMLIAYVHPLYLWIWCRQKRKQYKSLAQADPKL